MLKQRWNSGVIASSREALFVPGVEKTLLTKEES